MESPRSVSHYGAGMAPTAFLTVASFLGVLTALSVSAVEPLPGPDILSDGMCIDHKGEKVDQGMRYFPMGSDRCTECTCINGKSEMCISVFCSPPENCRQPHELNDKCCEFVCLDGDLDRPISNHNNTVLKTNDSETINATNLGLRLVASTVTSFLILALLLFMIHRLRQRRLLLMIRRIQSRRMQAAGNHLSRRLSLEDDASVGYSVGYFVGDDQIDFAHYNDPPPPYMFWKPPEAYMPPGEAPPPYEASIGPYNTFYALINGTLVDVTRNDGTLSNPYPTIGTVLPSQGQIPINEHNVLPSTPPKRVEDRGTQAPPPSTTVQPQVTDQSVQAHQNQLTRSESTSTVSMHSENDTTTSAAIETAAIASDAQYEDLPSYLPNNVTVLHIGESVTPVLNLRDEDLVNGNVCPASTTIKELYTSVPQAHRPIPCPCANGRNSQEHRTRNSNCRHKCHSYGDFINYWQNHVSNRRHGVEQRRHSLQPSSNGQNNNFYPDPTSWTGEGSESSSSSSPTYEQPTLSPSSSDSSSMDVDFEPETFGVGDKDGTVPHRSAGGSEQRSTKNRSYSLDKKLLQLKKFSLPHKKKKADKVTQVEENQIQTSNIVHTSSLLRHPRSSNPHTAHSIAFCNELKGARASLKPVFTVEAVNKMFGDKPSQSQAAKSSEEQSRLAKSKAETWVGQVTLRPTSLPLSSDKIEEDKMQVECSSGTSQSGNRSCDCVPPCYYGTSTCVPVSPPAVGIHSSATATISQLSRGPPVTPPSCSDISTDGVEAYITQQQAIHLSTVQNPSSSVKPKISISCMSCHNSGSDHCNHIVQSQRTRGNNVEELRGESPVDGRTASVLHGWSKDGTPTSSSETECCRDIYPSDVPQREDQDGFATQKQLSKKSGRMKVGSKNAGVKRESSSESQHSGHLSDCDNCVSSKASSSSDQRTKETVNNSAVQKTKLAHKPDVGEKKHQEGSTT